MNITNRQQIIFLSLLKGTNVTLKQLNKDLNLSERTITKEIDRLNQFFLKYDTQIILKARSGISLKTIYTKSELTNIINANRIIDTNSQFQLLLLKEIEYVSFNQLEEYLLISRSSIDKLIKKYEVKLKIKKQNRLGVKSLIDAKQRLRLIANLITLYVDNVNYRSSLLRVLEQLEYQFDYSILQIDLSKLIDLNIYTDASIKKYYICVVLASIYNVEQDFSNELRIRKLSNLNDLNDQSYKLIKIVNEAVNSEITLSNETLLALINHLNITLSQSQLFLQNETYLLYKEMRNFEKKYPLASQLALRIINQVSASLNVVLDEYESYFLALHLQSGMLKMEQNDSKKLLIICEYGLGMSNFLSAKLELKVPHIKLIKCVSMYEYFTNYDDYSEFDLLITTVINFEDEHRNVMYVSPFLSDEEIKKIEMKLITSNQLKILDKLINQNLIKVIEVDNEQSLIKQIMTDISPFVKPEYEASLIKRMSDEVYVENMTILPHANPQFVLENIIVIYRIKNSFQINQESVKLVIVNCFDTKFMHQNTRFIRYYYRLLTDGTKINQIINCDTDKIKSEILDIIRS